jgi:hypothetical protein
MRANIRFSVLLVQWSFLHVLTCPFVQTLFHDAFQCFRGQTNCAIEMRARVDVLCVAVVEARFLVCVQLSLKVGFYIRLRGTA